MSKSIKLPETLLINKESLNKVIADAIDSGLYDKSSNTPNCYNLIIKGTKTQREEAAKLIESRSGDFLRDYESDVEELKGKYKVFKSYWGVNIRFVE